MVNAIQIVAVASPASLPSFQVNAGGPAYTDASQSIWSADANYSGGSTWSVSNSVTGTTSPSLYQTCRYGFFGYNFTVPNGSYKVTLKFAEITQFAAGTRVFNVAINGSPVLTNFDIYVQAGGGLIALDKVFPVTVTGGQVSIQFTGGPAGLPLVNAVQVAPAQ